MDSTGKAISAPLLALALVVLIGAAARFAPGGSLFVSSGTEEQQPQSSVIAVSSDILGEAPDLLGRVSDFGIETILPPVGSVIAPVPKQERFLARERQTSALPADRPTRALSDYEIFAILHPPYYLAYLGILEDLMVQDGFMKPGEKQVFDSEGKVIAFLKDKVFDYMVLKGVAGAVDRARFERGLEVVQELHRNEANILRFGLDSGDFAPSAFWRSVLGRIQGRDFFEALTSGFFYVRAQAQGECYREGVSGPVPGSNVGAICCDCSINGVPVGCLNGVCPGQPAIFDTTLFICGCNT